MHGRIFVFKDEKMSEDDIFFPEWENIKDACPMADYYNEDTFIEEDVEWLSNAYGIKLYREKNGELHFYINSDEFLRVLKEDRVKRLEKVKEILEKKPLEEINDADVYKMRELINDSNGFLYTYGVLEVLTGDNLIFYFEKEKPEKLEIVTTIDYHY